MFHFFGREMSIKQVKINKDLARMTSASDVVLAVSCHVADFNLVNCTTALQRLAKSEDGRHLLGCGGNSSALAVLNKLLDTAAALVRHRPHDIESRTTASMLHACGKLGLVGHKQAETLLCEIEKSVGEQASIFNPQELSNSIWGVAKLGIDRRRMIVKVLCNTISKSFTAERHIAVQLKVPNKRIRRSLSVDWTEQGVSNVAWSLATLGVNVNDVFHAQTISTTFTAVNARAGRFNAQELANILWAAAKIVTTGVSEKDGRMTKGVEDKSEIDLISKSRADAVSAADALVGHISKSWIASQNFEPRHVANIMWACAKLGLDSKVGKGDPRGYHSKENVYLALAAPVTCAAPHMNTQELSMCAWALAAFGIVDGTEAVVEAFASRARKATPRQLATTVAALAKLGEGGERHAELFDSVVDAVAAIPEPRCNVLKPQDVANLAWAFAKIGRKKKRLFNCLSEVFVAHASLDVQATSYSPQQLTMILWAFAMLDLKYQTLLTAVIVAVKARIQEFNPRDITNTAWALDSLGVNTTKDASLVRKIGRTARRQFYDFNSQELLKFLGAYERLGGLDTKLNAAVSAERELRYSFPSLMSVFGCSDITLTSRIPVHYTDAGAERVDDSCHGSGRGNTGVTMWEGSFVLAEWLSRATTPRHSNHILAVLGGLWSKSGFDTWNGRVGVELGAGLGLPSIVASKLGIVMVSTDGACDLRHFFR